MTMTSNVKLSHYAFVITLVISVALIAGCVALLHEPGFWILLGVLVLLLIAGLLWGPVRISSNQEEVVVKTYLRKKRLPVSNIESVELFQPTMGAYRLCGSGGYFGYWGLFREGDIGKYMAYYGKASDCFLIRMKDGGLYVLGCMNPEKMVENIRSHIQG